MMRPRRGQELILLAAVKTVFIAIAIAIDVIVAVTASTTDIAVHTVWSINRNCNFTHRNITIVTRMALAVVQGLR